MVIRQCHVVIREPKRLAQMKQILLLKQVAKQILLLRQGAKINLMVMMVKLHQMVKETEIHLLKTIMVKEKLSLSTRLEVKLCLRDCCFGIGRDI